MQEEKRKSNKHMNIVAGSASNMHPTRHGCSSSANLSFLSLFARIFV